MKVRLILKDAHTIYGQADVYVSDGRIVSIDVLPQPGLSDDKGFTGNSGKGGLEQIRVQIADDLVIDCSGKIVLAGFIDPHVHARDMNLAHKETFLSASRAAIAGGVCSFLDMPNSSPPADSREGLLAKKEAARASLVNYGFYAGAAPGRIDTLAALLNDRRKLNVGAVKIFFAASSANEVLSRDEEIEAVLRLCALHDVPCVAHCEKHDMIAPAAGRTAIDHHRVRPPEAAEAALRQLIPLQKKTGARVAVAHVSTAAEIALIRKAKSEGAALYCEATPHHLFLNATRCESAGNYAKINPPLRDMRDCEALQEALCDMTIDYVGTDHSPHTLEEKNRDYETAPSGFPGLETGTHLLIDYMLKQGLSLERTGAVLSENASKIFGLDGRGVLKKDAIADLVVIDPEQYHSVRPEKFFSQAHYSPFENMWLKGRVIMTIVDGVPLFQNGELTDAAISHKGTELFNEQTGIHTPASSDGSH